MELIKTNCKDSIVILNTLNNYYPKFLYNSGHAIQTTKSKQILTNTNTRNTQMENGRRHKTGESIVYLFPLLNIALPKIIANFTLDRNKYICFGGGVGKPSETLKP